MKKVHGISGGFWINDRYGNRQEWIEPEEYDYYPTLGEVHSRLFDDFGPLSVSWHDEWLCPFATGVSRKMMRCVDGRRQRGHHHCGFLIRDEDVNPQWLTDKRKRQRLIGRVLCYPWDHELTTAYWNIDQTQYYDWPDDPYPIVVDILRKVYRATNWQAWRNEKAARKEKPKWEWMRRKETDWNHYVP